MEELENLFKNDREGFDHLDPDPQWWDGVSDRLEPAPKRSRRPWLAAAGMVALLCLSATLFWWINRAPGDVGLGVAQKFPDLVLFDTSGAPVKLSDLQGKVVLVEFWASWSTVCTEENCYYFEPIYNEFSEQGFEIYAVSLDHSKDDWLQGIARDELPWLHVSDLEGLDSELTQRFEVDRLPATFLLDSDGRVVAKDVAADELRTHLTELFASNY